MAIIHDTDQLEWVILRNKLVCHINVYKKFTFVEYTMIHFYITAISFIKPF